jgi:hypothetical protein
VIVAALLSLAMTREALQAEVLQWLRGLDLRPRSMDFGVAEKFLQVSLLVLGRLVVRM